MNTERKLAIIALVLWSAVAVMAYTNVWARMDTTVTNYQTDPQWNPSTNKYDLVEIPYISQVDVFPHDQLEKSIWITGIIAAIPTAAIFLFDFSKKPSY